MARLQVNIDDEVSDILNSFNRTDQKRLFIEYAIKSAAKNPEVCEIFGLTDRAQLSVPAKDKLQVMDVIQTVKGEVAPGKVTIDNEFSDG
ncbi:MAG: hypothetical protein K2X04_00990 [Burkholderiales bacterium]|nr:hypothetical protein [Burkholderiales bacterium]